MAKGVPLSGNIAGMGGWLSADRFKPIIYSKLYAKYLYAEALQIRDRFAESTGKKGDRQFFQPCRQNPVVEAGRFFKRI
jgi:hypothetical protein